MSIKEIRSELHQLGNQTAMAQPVDFEALQNSVRSLIDLVDMLALKVQQTNEVGPHD